MKTQIGCYIPLELKHIPNDTLYNGVTVLALDAMGVLNRERKAAISWWEYQTVYC